MWHFEYGKPGVRTNGNLSKIATFVLLELFFTLVRSLGKSEARSQLLQVYLMFLLWEVNRSTLHERGTKNILNPRQESSSWPPEHMAGALSWLSYESSWRARTFNWVHMWQASCILLGSALSKPAGDNWIKMVNFKLGNEMWKVNWSTWHERATKKITV